jgi:hypothetical protein
MECGIEPLREIVPQRLKPSVLFEDYGTAEAVPFPNSTRKDRG